MTPTDTIIALEKALEAGPTPSWAAQPEEIGWSYIRIRGTALGERFKVANVLQPAYDEQSSEQLWQRDKAETRANAEFIAAANPLAIRTLLDAHAGALSELAELKADADRLDYLDTLNARKNERNDTIYGWWLSENHNRIALEDNHWKKLSAREAIDAARALDDNTKGAAE